MSNWDQGNQQGWGGQPQQPSGQGWGQPGQQGQPGPGQWNQGQQGQWGQQNPVQQGWGQQGQGQPQGWRQQQPGQQPFGQQQPGQQGWGQPGQQQPGQNWGQQPPGPGGQPPRKKNKWLLPVIIGGALVVIVGLILGLGVFNKDEEAAPPGPVPTSEPSSGTSSEPVRQSRQPAPTTTSGGGNSGGPARSSKSVKATLPEKVGEYSREGNSEGSASYMKGQDFNSLFVVVAQPVPIGADEYLEAAGVATPETVDNFLCGKDSGQTQCATQMSDGILVVLADASPADTGAFANQLLEAM